MTDNVWGTSPVPGSEIGDDGKYGSDISDITAASRDASGEPESPDDLSDGLPSGRDDADEWQLASATDTLMTDSDFARMTSDYELDN